MPTGQPINWQKLKLSDEEVGRLCFYHSDQDSSLPVRSVRRRWDNKSDPNLETKTWGLFSTCMPAIRKGIVSRGDRYLFFFTNWRGERRIMGYYEVGWFAVTGLSARDARGILKFLDYAILAKKLHFVKEGIVLGSKRRKASKVRPCWLSPGVIQGYGPRASAQADARLTGMLKQRLDRERDCTVDYVTEIHRIENMSLESTGYRYPSWHRIEGFDTRVMSDFVK